MALWRQIFCLSVAALCGSIQAGVIPFIPTELPQTVKPSPVPFNMVDSPKLPLGVSVGVEPCRPSLIGLRMPQVGALARAEAKVSRRIQAIVKADQQARQGTLSAQMIKTDEQRRQALLPLIPQAVTPQDLTGIALVFQHGNCLQHVQLAHQLATLAIPLIPEARVFTSPYTDPRWLSAAALDRALWYVGRAQKYGTQYFSLGTDCPRLYVVDPRVTDQERAEFHVPSLKIALAGIQQQRTPGCITQ